jgi:predicted ATPase
MRLSKLQLKRFKTFHEEEIELGRITLLTGANSSGKTSILQSLCAITQGREGIGFPFDFRLNGPLVRLGDFRNVINGHSVKGSFDIGIEVEHEGELLSVRGTYKAAEEGGTVATRAIELEDHRSSLNISWNQKQQAFFLEYKKGTDSSGPYQLKDLFSASAHDLGFDAVTALTRVITSTHTRTRTTDSVLHEAVKTTNFDVDKFQAFLLQQEQELQKGKIRLTAGSFAEAHAEVRKLFLAESTISRVKQKVARALRQVAYVGAVRAHPLRYYAASTSITGFDPYGEGVSLRLAQWKESNKERFNAVKDALIQLELATDLRAETNLGEFVQVRITPKDRKYTDTIADVGFGISQVLPIVVADIGLGAEGTLLINQPEVHLHPSSQALLGNYFAGRVSTRQYVIETHSEYLVTRFRILVAQKKLRPEDVSLYFVMPGPDNSGKLARRIHIAENGDLIDPPKEFFRTYIADSYELALNSFGDSE